MNFSGKMSQLAGLGDIVDGIVGGLSSTIQYLINGYLSLLANWFYTIFLALATVLDVIQMLFRKMAGLEYYIVNGQQTAEPRDLALEIINNQIIMNVFWSLVVLGVVLLFITTFVAVIKSEYQPLDTRGGNNKGKIIGKSLKSIMLMATVPVAAVLGLIIGNALLKSLDMATSNSQDATLSGRIFVAAAFESNRAREGLGSFDQGFLDRLSTKNNFGLFVGESSGFIVQTVADKIDRAFAHYTRTPGNENWKTGDEVDKSYTYGFKVYQNTPNVPNPENYFVNPTLSFVYDYMGEPDYPVFFSIYNYRLVWYYYDINNFNFFVGIGVVIMLLAILLQVLLGLIKRLYGLTMLFIVVPPIIALTPINEEPYKKWKGEFIKNALSAYSTVVVMNIYIMLIPVLGSIQFFTPTDEMFGLVLVDVSMQVLNLLAQLLILIGGAVFFKDFSGALAGIIGADDALKDGAGKSQDFLKAASKSTAIGGAIFGSGVKMMGGGLLGGVAETGVKAAKGMHATYKNARENGWGKLEALEQAAFSPQLFKAGAGVIKDRFAKTFGDGQGHYGLKNAVDKFTQSNVYKKSGIETLFAPNAKSMKEKSIQAEERNLRKLQMADLQAKQAERKQQAKDTAKATTPPAAEAQAEAPTAEAPAAAEPSMFSDDVKASYMNSKNIATNYDNVNSKIATEEKELSDDAQLKKRLRKYKDDVLYNKEQNLESLKKERAKYEKQLNDQKQKFESLETALKSKNLSVDDVIKNEKTAVSKLSKTVVDAAKEIKKIQDALNSSKK
ncbi:MAG: hypothetical protein CVV59_01700 [Tenericutes bacterium HGW-Tenericutes-4]|nr:MAG: hypothetical protein CVV59_01700 [Tenericutes bacterium HGW-Tenericutes-4]